MTIALPAILDTPAAAPLRQTLRDAIGTGRPIQLDASGVERIGQACLQVLAAAEVAAEEAGQPFHITGASPVFADMATLAALDTLLAA
ncbi:STAS domain-containing protein [uncultured Sphingomonas sp.]|uniref:STAS domain-containing protein n=1 Tax=uncultured Sphingomonas sp. TaxID=158754 RepID=UPI0025E78262|nr:STAS domain-containing protein [uncultured Sphingomonas sp.]